MNYNNLPYTGAGPYGHGEGCPVQIVQRGNHEGSSVVVLGQCAYALVVNIESTGERTEIFPHQLILDNGEESPILRYVDPVIFK